MAVTKGKKKKPPTFHYLPKSRAQRLKKSRIEDHKLRSKWKAQKRREGLPDHTSIPGEHASDRAHVQSDTNAEPDTSPNRLDKSHIPAPSHDKQVLRNLRKMAYAPKDLSAEKADSLPPKRVRTHPLNNNRGERVTSARRQPNMKLRMNILLEEIKRDFS